MRRGMRRCLVHGPKAAARFGETSYSVHSARHLSMSQHPRFFEDVTMKESKAPAGYAGPPAIVQRGQTVESSGTSVCEGWNCVFQA